jgi:hypothetical protein
VIKRAGLAVIGAGITRIVLIQALKKAAGRAIARQVLNSCLFSGGV